MTLGQETPINTLPFNKRDVHQSVSSELEELAAAFALETLEIDEGDAYRDHLRACPVCRGLLGEFQTVVNILPVALDVTPTRSELKDLILAEAMADFESEFTGPLVELLKAEPKFGWRDWITPRILALSGAVAAVIVALVVWNINLQFRLDDQNEVNSDRAILVDAIADASSITLLPGTDKVSGASGTLVPEGEVLLFVRDMPTIPPHREFQVWSIIDSRAASIGVFKPLRAPDRVVAFAFDFSESDAIGVSIEPIGGSAAPTGHIVLLGTR